MAGKYTKISIEILSARGTEKGKNGDGGGEIIFAETKKKDVCRNSSASYPMPNKRTNTIIGSHTPSDRIHGGTVSVYVHLGMLKTKRANSLVRRRNCITFNPRKCERIRKSQRAARKSNARSCVEFRRGSLMTLEKMSLSVVLPLLPSPSVLRALPQRSSRNSRHLTKAVSGPNCMPSFQWNPLSGSGPTMIPCTHKHVGNITVTARETRRGESRHGHVTHWLGPG